MTATDTASPIPADLRSKARAHLGLSLGLLLITAGMLFFAGLGRLPLVEPDEGRNAEVGREMLASGDWITPHYNGFTYLDKPALYFWMVAGSFKMLGVSEFAARVPSALMGVATVLLIWFLARRMFGNAAGVRAGMVFAACPLPLILAREVIFDMTLTFLVTAAMVAFWLVEEVDFRSPWFDALMFAAMGLATITKGFVGLLIPLGSVLIYEAARGRWRQSLRLRWGWGLLILLVTALPWFIAVSLRNPDFPRYALWNESLKRFTTGASHRGGGFLYYVPIFLGGFFPWSFFLLLAGWNHLRRWRELRWESGRPTLFLLCWAVWVFVFFTTSHSKLPAYFLPAVVPLSILVGVAWGEVGKDASVRSPDWLTAGFTMLLGLGVLVAAASHSWLYAHFQARLAKRLPPDLLGLLQPSLLYTGLILAALGYLGRRLAAQTRGRVAAIATFALAAITVPIIALRWYPPLQLLAESQSSRRLAETILASPERDCPVFGYYYFRTGLPFYLHRPVGLLSIEWGEMTSNYQVAYQAAARRTPGTDSGKGILVTVPEFQSIARGNPQPVLVLTPVSLVRDLWKNVGRGDPEWNESDFFVWEIPPAKPGEVNDAASHLVPPFRP